jgi:Fe2+ transport system protein FeoA
MPDRPRKLAELRPGEFAKIVDVAGSAELRHCLLEMGLTRGTTVRMVRAAPLGDPVELNVRGYRLCLRKSEAASVRVEAA